MYIQWNIQFSSVIQSCPTLWDSLNRSMPGLPVHHQLLEFTQTHVHWVGDAIQPSHPLSSPSPPAFKLPRIKVLSNESVLHIRWPKYWSFSFSISPSNEYSNRILLSHIEGWTNATWSNIVTLSEVSQDKDKYCMILIICRILKNGTNELIYKTDIESQMYKNLWLQEVKWKKR